jgi:TP901 family phage tail tape measure protein
MAFDLMDVFVKIGADTSELEGGINKAKGLASGIGGAVGAGMKAVGTAIAGATAAVGGFAASSVKVGATFDSSMSQVAATMGVTVDEIGDLRQFAQDMGATTAFSATQAADALNYMALAGYDADKSMQMLPNVLNLAAAGGMELATASDMVTDAQSALGLSMDETTQLVDKMAKASSKSNTSVQQLGDAILTIGGTAQSLAGGTTELSTALGILADNSIKGAEGGTALRNIVLSLSSPTDKAADTLENLGVTTTDAAGNLRPLEEIMGELGTSLDGLGTAERSAVIASIFNKTDIAAVNAMLGTSAERWDELAGAIDDSAGAADKMAKTQLDNLEGSITLFKSALEGAQILISDALTPALKDFVDFGTDGITKISEGFKEGGLSGAMTAFGDVLADGIGMITEMLPDAVDAGIQLLEAVGKGLIDNAPKIFDAVVEIGGMVLEKSAEIMQKVADGLAQFDFASAVGSIVDTIVGFLTGDSATKMRTAGVQIIGSLVNGFIEALPELVQGAAEILTSIGEGIKDGLPEFVSMAMEVLTDFSEGLGDNLSVLLDAGIEMIMALADGIINSLPVLISNIPTIITNVVKALTDNLPKIMQMGGELIVKLVAGLIQAIPSLIAAIPELVKAIFNAWKSINFLTLGIQLVQGIIKGLVSIVPSLFNAIKDLASKAIKIFKETDWKALGIDLITKIVDGIKNLASKLAEAVKSLATKAVDTFKNTDWIALGKAVIEKLITGLQNVSHKINDFFAGLAKKAWESITSFFGKKESDAKASGNTKNVAVNFADRSRVESAQDALQDVYDSVNPSDVDAVVDVANSGESFDSNSGFEEERKLEALADAIVDAFVRADIGIDVDGREFGRLVRKAVAY